MSSIQEKETDVFSSFGFYSVPDLTEEERKPPEFIVDSMIEVGMNVLSGRPKLRKSFLALQMGIAVATGTPFFGHRTLKSDVAYLDLEGTRSRISTRTQNMSVPVPRNLYVTNNVQERLANGKLTDKIRLLHRQHPSIRLVIVDTFSKARGEVKSTGSNAYDQDTLLLSPVQRMAVEEGIALLFVTHDRKGGGMFDDPFERVNGSTGIVGTADSIMNLTGIGQRFEGRAKLEFNSRDAKGGELDLIFNESCLEWQQHELNNDLRGNPVCSWILENLPEPKREGVFTPYEQIYREAYHGYSDTPGDAVKKQILPFLEELKLNHNAGIQLGVKSHGERGIRLFNLK